jgi:hypothetical protein
MGMEATWLRGRRRREEKPWLIRVLVDMEIWLGFVPGA